MPIGSICTNTPVIQRMIDLYTYQTSFYAHEIFLRVRKTFYPYETLYYEQKIFYAYETLFLHAKGFLRLKKSFVRK